MFCLGLDRWCQLMWPTTQLTTASRPARRSASWSCPGWPPSSDLSQQHHPIMFRWGVTSHHHHPIMFRGGVTSQEHHLITFRWGVTSQQHHPIMGEACDLTATSSITFRWGVWRHSNIIQSRSGEAWFHISLILCESWRLSNITNHVDNKYKKG